MFLTDKGKELMMKQNNFGLSELITRFTLYDEDFDYRTSSRKWWDGVSPNPQMNTPPGSDQNLVNDYAIYGHINKKWKNPTTGQSEYHASTDVRGHRGHNVLSCFPELETVHIENCTNIYCFYDVTSVAFTDAEVAKASLDAWATGYSQTNSAWTGMVFHIPVYGERWVLSSYYPWNGELDVFSYDIQGSTSGPIYSPNSVTAAAGIPPIPGSITVYDDLTTIVPISDPTAHDDGAYYGVTGLFNGVMCNQPYPTTGWSVLPPGTITSAIEGEHIPGSKLEWWVTGCTYDIRKMKNLGLTDIEAGVSASTATTCVHTGVISDICQGNTGYTQTSAFPYQCTGATWSPIFSGETVPTIEFITNGSCACWPSFVNNPLYNGGFNIRHQKGVTYATKQLDLNQCDKNCCADDTAVTGSIFGCQDCNPHLNSIGTTTGRTITYILRKNVGCYSGTYGWGGACEGWKECGFVVRRVVQTWVAPCDKFKGGDRNVLIINNTDETRDAYGIGHCCSNSTAGGIMPLGEKNYYGLPPVTVNSPNTNTIATWGTPFGERGYQGKIGTDTNLPMSTQARQEYRMGWSELTTSTDILQPSKDWLYSQDLHCRTLPFYNTFLGFLYPVVKNTDEARLGFLQHSYAAIMGTTVPFADLPVNATAQSIVGGGITNALQALSSNVTGLGVVGQNPYSELIPVQYSKSLYMLTQGYGPLKTPPWGYTLQGNMDDQMNDGHTNNKIVSGLDAAWINCDNLTGLKNYGWGLDAEIGCISPTCNGAQMFSPGVYIKSLNNFLSGDTVQQVKTVCTYCQCLPTVFINRTGPPGTTVVNPCPNPPCTPPPVVVDQLCGPTPLLGTTINTNFTASNPFAPNKND